MHMQYVEGMAKEKAQQLDHKHDVAAIWKMNIAKTGYETM